MQTILGSGGAIGTPLAAELKKYTSKICLVSRNPQKVNDDDELFSADITKEEQVLKAVEGSDVVYLTVGYPYKAKVWEKLWPPTMKNVIKACEENGAKLVFLDNIYMYDKYSLKPATEESKINPPSKKGKVRAYIAEMLLEEIEEGRIEALIARSADFYGPGIDKNSVLNETVVKNLAKGKKAMWLGNAKYKHSFTYTPDAAKAAALLGNTPEAYGEVWHLPTADNPPAGEEWIEVFAEKLDADPKYSNLPKYMLLFLGIFMPVLREMAEMVYQNDRDYVFDSSKFEKRFDFKPTPYEKGIEEVVKADYRK